MLSISLPTCVNILNNWLLSEPLPMNSDVLLHYLNSCKQADYDRLSKYFLDMLPALTSYNLVQFCSGRSYVMAPEDD